MATLGRTFSFGSPAAKDVLSVVDSDVLKEKDDQESTLGADMTKMVAAARAIIIQGLGDHPVRLCLPVKKKPFQMWSRLRYRYSVSNKAT